MNYSVGNFAVNCGPVFFHDFPSALGSTLDCLSGLCVCVLLALTARVIWIIHCTDMYYRAHWLFCSVSVSVLSLRSSCGFLLEADRPGSASTSLNLISMEVILSWLHINAWYMYTVISSTHVYHPQWNVMFGSVNVKCDLPVVYFSYLSAFLSSH